METSKNYLGQHKHM